MKFLKNFSLSLRIGVTLSFLSGFLIVTPLYAAQPSLKPPSESEVLSKASQGLDSNFWRRFNIFRTKETQWQREKANDFASLVGCSLPSLDFIADYPLVVFQVMPLLHIGIGQQVVLFLGRADFHPTGNVPIRLWFDNGESIGFSQVKWVDRPVFAVLSDENESLKLSKIIQTGALPVLISQGKAGLRLRYNETPEGNEALLWYQKASNPQNNMSLQKHILSKMEALDKKRVKEEKKQRKKVLNRKDMKRG
ncbi:hypothetical protein FAI41_00845 [Acetobacteraceae bacterium]|nr:hypothetical protein FAI41_00845 [Acetobacteraceae bacterium]